MDPDVSRLVAEQRLVAAAELASTRGDPKTASALYERACEFRHAAREAQVAGDHGRALSLALEGKDLEVAAASLGPLLADPASAERVAYALERRGDHGWAGRLLEGIGKRKAAAAAFEKDGEARDAARLLEAEGDVVAAARVLQAQVRRTPHDADLLLALGDLLLRYGKTDAAVRTLQQIAQDAPQRRLVLTLLATGFERLGLAEAENLAREELHALGGPLELRHDEAPAAPVRARVFGRYEVIGEIASSPSARVLECTDGVRNERVAVKIFAAYDARGAGRDALARFEREVRVLGTLDHPNVVPLRDYVPEGPALVLAWMPGGTLATRLAKEALAPARAVEIAQAVLSALGEAHRLGVIHRDVKPANVLFDAAGVTRLGDFGAAHLSDLSATATAGVIGTLGYMSPEQREGKPATVRSDLYGVGAILWEMLTGERPEAGLGAATLRVRPSAVHKDLDARHDALVLSFLSLDPEQRPDDAFSARKALGALRWPASIEHAALRSEEERPRSVRPAALRLVPEPDGSGFDQWLGRRVATVALDPESLARASRFARAEHAALQTVLRVDRVAGRIWLGELRGAPLTGKLTPTQAAELREALERLHQLGQLHGSVNERTVFVDDSGGVTLAFGDPKALETSIDLDRLALARLC